MPTALESRAALKVVTTDAVATASEIVGSVDGSPTEKRLMLLNEIPPLIDYYANGTGSLASDFYDETRDLAAAPGKFTAQVVVADRTVKIRRAIAWAAQPWFETLDITPEARLAEIVQLEVATAYRDTITWNRRRDPAAVGWRRVTAGGCKFCRMLADRGAVYRQATARFAAHTGCHCGAEPVFSSNDTGETASVIQYVASKKNRSPAQQDALRDYLDSFY